MAGFLKCVGYFRRHIVFIMLGQHLIRYKETVFKSAGSNYSLTFTK